MNQEKALAILKSGRNVFLTGSAGTGKTHVLNTYIRYLKQRKIAVGVTASTGIAATHLQGLTIHSWSGMGVRSTISPGELAHMATKKYVQETLEKVKVLVIDEISMLHRTQFELVNTILRYFKQNDQPFGGIQIVVCGDFFQLPPVSQYQENSKDKFSFMSPLWVETDFVICYLTEQFRQSHTSLPHVLNELRNNQISQTSIDLLQSRNIVPENTQITQLYTHNADVDDINQRYLQAIHQKAHLFKAKATGNKQLIEGLYKSILTSRELILKKGAKVIFVKNNYEKGYVNGTLGTVVAFNDEGFPVVETQEKKNIVADPQDWEIRNETGKKLAGVSQVPLQLAWAMTVHKSQGMTLDEAQIDLSKTFERGQGYVALSRLRSIEHLYLTGFNDIALETDPLAYKADLRFKALSEEADHLLSFEKLIPMAQAFVLECGGVLMSEKELQKAEKKQLFRASKTDTYNATLEYLEKGLSLDEIAGHRGMSVKTIVKHMSVLKERLPDLDLSAYKPNVETLSVVQKAVDAIYPSNTIKHELKLKPIYDSLQGKVSYLDIELARLFF